MNTKLFKIETWLTANRLTLNVNKTNYMIFHRSLLKARHCDVILNDDIVKRDLNKASWYKSTLRNLYYTLVYPYLIYCVEVWGNSCSTYLEPLIVKQKQCILFSLLGTN